MKKVSRLLKKTAGIVLSAALCFSFIDVGQAAKASAASTNLVENGSFENGTTDGWVGRGGVETLTATKDTARTGSYSMLVADRAETWNGPSYDITDKVSKGQSYNMKVYVKAVSGQSSSHSEQASLSIQKTDDDGTTYSNVKYNAPINENSWTELSGQYTLTYTGTLSALSIYVEASDATLEYYIDDVEIDGIDMTPQTDLTSIGDYYKDDFNIGVAVDPASQLDSSDPHSALIAKHFNSITAGNCMKVDATEPKEGVFTFTAADAICDFAIAHNMKVRGHNLLWHNQIPDWFFEDPNDPSKAASRSVVLSRLNNHITTVLKHFKDKYGDKNPIYCWDVCNEVISDNHYNDGLRGSQEKSKWLDTVGPDYIEKAFEYAHEADPSMQLYINDYNIEDNTQKTTDMYNEVKKLLSENIPIDGIGIQMHVQNDYPSLSSVKTSIEKLASLGVKLQITEMDCSTKNDTSSSALATQAARYENLFKLFLSEKQYINSVTVWGVSDDCSWLGASNAPLLFDSTLAAKPAYYSIMKIKDTASSAISPVKASFNLNPANQADIPVALTLNGNTLSGIYNNTTALIKGTDYTYDSTTNTVTIKSSYLAKQSAGVLSLTFKFSAGLDTVLPVTITSIASPAILPTTLSYDKYNAADVPVTVTLNGSTLGGIYNGTTALTEGTDYTYDEDAGTVTIKSSYLSSLDNGSYSLRFDVSSGTDPVLAVTVSDTTPVPSSKISPNTASFDLKTSKQADVPVTLTLNGNTLKGIYNGSDALTEGTDYTYDEDAGIVTISKDYLAKQSVGTTTLTFKFSAGDNASLAVTITDTTNSFISPNTAVFDLNTKKQADIPVAITLNGNTLEGIYNGTEQLAEGADYTVADDGTVTILKDYLAKQSVGTVDLTFRFSEGEDQILTVTVKDTTGTNNNSLEVQMYNSNTASSTNGITPHFKLINNGTTSIDLSSVKLRYYFTNNGTQQDSFWCDYSPVGSSNVTGTFGTLENATDSADTYLEIGFASAAGSLAPGASTEVQARFSKNDWSNFTQTDDYSFDSSDSSYVNWTKVTGYIDGDIVWGVEPTGSSTPAAISSLEDAAATTVAGTAPTLPSTVKATYSDGTTKDVAVTWDAVDASSYASAGTFTVSGTVADTSLKATCTVTVDETPAAKTITALEDTTATTVAGTVPALPGTVKATYSDGTTADVAVTWGAVDADSYAAAGTFTVTGTVADTDLTVTCTVTVNEKPVVPAGNLKVQMYNANTQTSTNGIAPRFKLTNTGDTAIDLSKITLRYYFTEDGAQPQSFWCDWSSVGSGNVIGTFNDGYLEIGFASAAGTLAPGASIEIQARFAKNDWSNYDQSNDYSFDSTDTSYADWTKVPAYQDGSAIWGVEP